MLKKLMQGAEGEEAVEGEFVVDHRHLGPSRVVNSQAGHGLTCHLRRRGCWRGCGWSRSQTSWSFFCVYRLWKPGTASLVNWEGEGVEGDQAGADHRPHGPSWVVIDFTSWALSDLSIVSTSLTMNNWLTLGREFKLVISPKTKQVMKSYLLNRKAGFSYNSLFAQITRSGHNPFSSMINKL